MTDLVKAYWNCSWPAEIAGQGIIGFGDTAMVPRAEAEGSDHWRLSTPPKSKPRARRPRKPKVPTPPPPGPAAASITPRSDATDSPPATDEEST